MTTAIAAAIIAAIGVLATILGLCGKAVWELAKRVQKDTDVAEQAAAALKDLPEKFKAYEDQLAEIRNLQPVVHEAVRAINRINRRVAAMELVVGKQDPEALGIAQAAAQDEDSAVHFVDTTKNPEEPA